LEDAADHALHDEEDDGDDGGADEVVVVCDAVAVGVLHCGEEFAFEAVEVDERPEREKESADVAYHTCVS